MPIIKNIGKRDRLVADRIMRPSDSKLITAKQAQLLANDSDFKIEDEAPLRSAVEVVSPQKESAKPKRKRTKK